MAVTEKKKGELEKRMRELGILEEDIEESFIKGSGKGGQKINKSSTCVYLKHKKTGLEVKCQRDRSREVNRFLARRLLCELFEKRILGRESEKALKVRKQKKRRKRRGKLSRDI